MPDTAIPHHDCRGVLEIKGGSIPGEPFVLVIIMSEEPISLVFSDGTGFQASAAVVGCIHGLDPQAHLVTCPDRAPESVDFGNSDRDSLLAVDPDAGFVVLCRRG